MPVRLRRYARLWLLAGLLPLTGCLDAWLPVPPPLSAASEAEKRSYREIPPWPEFEALAPNTEHPPAAALPASLLFQPEQLADIGRQLQQLPAFGGQPIQLVGEVVFAHEQVSVVVQDPLQPTHYDRYTWQQGAWQRQEAVKLPVPARKHALPAAQVPWATAAASYGRRQPKRPNWNRPVHSTI